MTREQFYQRLADYLRAEKYASSAQPNAIRGGAKIPVWMTMAAWAVGGLCGTIWLHGADIEHAAARTAELEDEFNPMLSFTPLVFYKFVLGSISVFTAIESDGLSDGQMLHVVNTFDECLLKSTRFAAERKVYFVRKQQAGVVVGNLMFIFADSARACDFRHRLQKQCCIRHVRKMTYIHASAVDITQQQVFTHQTIRMFTALSNRIMTRKVFGPQAANPNAV